MKERCDCSLVEKAFLKKKNPPSTFSNLLIRDFSYSRNEISSTTDYLDHLQTFTDIDYPFACIFIKGKVKSFRKVCFFC